MSLESGSFEAIFALGAYAEVSQNVVDSRILVTNSGENLAELQRSDGAWGFPRPPEIPSFFIR